MSNNATQPQEEEAAADIPLSSSSSSSESRGAQARREARIQRHREINRLAKKIHAEMLEVFSRSNIWELEKMLGNGSYGVTVLLKYKNPLRIRDTFRVVLKRSLRPPSSDRPDDLIREISAYRVLNGNAHIARMLAFHKDVSIAQRGGENAWRRLTGPFRSPLRTVFPILSPLSGPAVLLEYIEQGSLSRFCGKLEQTRSRLPNRVLWSFYFCLIRACIGMAYPKRLPLGSTTQLETIPDGDPRQFRLVHGDIANRNIMLDSDDVVGEEEHAVAPVLKLIDFGLWQPAPDGDPNENIRANLFACTSTFLSLIRPGRIDIREARAVRFNGCRTLAVDILPVDGPNPLPHLDTELRDLLVVAMAVDPSDRPSLREMYERTKKGMGKKAGAYPGRLEESDDAINKLFQLLLYDA